MEMAFTGKDETDLQQQLWAWRTNHPNLKMTKQHPVERLPLQLSAPRLDQKIQAGDQVLMRIEYQD